MINREKILIALKRNDVQIILFLAGITCLGAILRFYRLTYQSLWVDEIITMNYTDPDIGFREMISYYRPGGDPHPPLFGILIHIWFIIFGFNDFTARLFVALWGLGSIVAMYFLGKEIKSREVGLFAALLTSVNYFNIYYSQEVRGYILSFLLATLSFLYLIRSLKSPGLKNNIVYAVFTLLLIYCHYFGLFALVSQIVIIGIFLLVTRIELNMLKWFSLSGLIILIGYLPWLGVLMDVSAINTFWMEAPASDFFATFFANYFNQTFLVYLFGTFIVIYVANVFLSSDRDVVSPTIPVSQKSFIFIVLTIWMLITYMIPYLRSIVVIPSLGDRYTIVVLPAILMILALTIDLVYEIALKVTVISVITIVSVLGLTVEHKFYHNLIKTEWKDVVEFIARQPEASAPIMTDYGWYQEYYFKQFGKKQRAWTISTAMDSLRQIKPTRVWYSTGHYPEPPGQAIQDYLNANYKLVKESSRYQAWAKLYAQPDYTPQLHGANRITDDGIHIMGTFGHLKTDSMTLAPGEYELVITGSGTEYLQQFPRIRVSVNNQQVLQFELSRESTTYTSDITVNQDTPIVVDIEYYQDPELLPGERNAYIDSFFILKKS